MEEWNDSNTPKYKNWINRSLIVSIFPTTAQDRLIVYLTEVGYKIVSRDPDLVAVRVYNRSINQSCPPYSKSVLTIKCNRENTQTRIGINYRINSLSPWEKAFYFAEIKDLQTALDSEVPIRSSTYKYLWMGYFIYIAIGILGVGGIPVLGATLASRVLPSITSFPKNHWVNGVTALFLTILMYIGGFLYLYKKSFPSKVKHW